MAKTVVELFDENNIENVISALALRPEKIVFAGFSKNMKTSKRTAIRKLFDAKGLDIKTEFVIVSRFDYQNIFDTLSDICDKYDDVVFDLTGGRELVILAMGDISARKNIPLVQFDVLTGEMIRVKYGEDVNADNNTALSVEESLILNGAKKIGDEKTGKFSKEMCRDIEKMWHLSCENSGLWNRQMTEFERLNKIFSISEDDMVVVDTEAVHGVKPFIETSFIKKLCDAGLLLDFSYENGILKYRYKNRSVHRCMAKAGNILELYGYMLLCEIMEEDGKYTDIDTSVLLDWDGDAGEENEGKYETTNEVDIIVMKKHNPVFISCKNGEVNKEALYELSAVCEHFGGEYAKKILLASYVCADEKKEKYLRQRASDMKIDVIYDVQKMSREEFKETLRKRV